jgi:hypothetical protein
LVPNNGQHLFSFIEGINPAGRGEKLTLVDKYLIENVLNRAINKEKRKKKQRKETRFACTLD